MAHHFTYLHYLSLLYLLLLTSSTQAHASSNGFDDSMDMPMSLASGSMLSYLHFTPGDVLWFEGWVPGRGSTLFGACVGLFLLGVVERWAAALAAGAMAATLDGQRRKGAKSNCCAPPLKDVLLMRGGTAAPFVLEHTWAKFILSGTQATFRVLFMFTIMTFQISFILSLAIGVGVGEMMYGRFTDAARAMIEREEVGEETH
ncbi:hypothetical protein C0991_007453 [Blastosporella zonata]|nr:hypothetical protein C0991_007453 [Blastosporella zonata]